MIVAIQQITEYPRGFFLELVRLHNFPPMFESRLTPPDPNDAIRHIAAVRSRATALARGHTGTIKGLSGRARQIVGDASKAQVRKAVKA